MLNIIFTCTSWELWILLCRGWQKSETTIYNMWHGEASKENKIATRLHDPSSTSSTLDLQSKALKTQKKQILLSMPLELLHKRQRPDPRTDISNGCTPF